ncbi:universal stress protein [Amphibacillus indicireducens]|uniref:Universal stress protein n=1 Tax=Amphibacillus indicireducens TaxID=1076330 RepID=A0ABP7VI63_9BACI
MFKNILLASDGSEYAIRACEKATYLAKHNPESKVIVLYVVDAATSRADVTKSYSSSDLDQSRKAKLEITERKLIEAGVSYEVVVLHGDPGPTIVKYANENNVDLCVIGSRGLNRLQEMVLGSVSHKVAKRVECPVMIVK